MGNRCKDERREAKFSYRTEKTKYAKKHYRYLVNEDLKKTQDQKRQWRKAKRNIRRDIGVDNKAIRQGEMQSLDFGGRFYDDARILPETEILAKTLTPLQYQNADLGAKKREMKRKRM